MSNHHQNPLILAAESCSCRLQSVSSGNSICG
jgi:hypothetical protein